MFEITGKHAKAKMYVDEQVEPGVISQVMELCNQPMFQGASIAIMPDTHVGKGCVIGFTAKLKERMVVPNLVGVDIGCGVYTLLAKTSEPIDFAKMDQHIRATIPCGRSIYADGPHTHPLELFNKMEKLVGIVNKGNLLYHQRSIGTLGGGNHYIEIGQLTDGRYAISVHSGSRNLGKKTCEYYQKLAEKTVEKVRHEIMSRHQTAKTPEEHQAIDDQLKQIPKTPKELSYLIGEDFDAYMEAMQTAQEFAARNRLQIAARIMAFFVNNLVGEIETFDTVHNYIEKITDEDGSTEYIIRKGAIRAEAGERVAIPLNMRDGVIIGTGKGNAEWNNSAPHGAGRLMSRSQAKAELDLDEFQREMAGIATWSVNASTLDESPMAYKPAQMIIDAIGDTVDIISVVKPLYNFKASE
jgi:tRNA-splicing ligase RtcB